MTNFKIGDKVLVPATVTYVVPGSSLVDVRLSDGTESSVLKRWATFAPYQDPDLRPGMVVMSEDESDVRAWWTQEGGSVDLWFVPASIHDVCRTRRDGLPARIRVVWPT